MRLTNYLAVAVLLSACALALADSPPPVQQAMTVVLPEGNCRFSGHDGSFILQAMGENVALSLPDARSQVLVDGGGMSRNAAGAGAGRMVELNLDNPDCTYSRANLSHDGITYWRHAALIKAGERWCVVVGDALGPADGNDHSFDWVMVSGAGNRITVDGQRARISGKNRAFTVQVLGAPDAVLSSDVLSHEALGEPGAAAYAYPRLTIHRKGLQGRFLVLIYPASQGPEVFPQMTDAALGAQLTWGDCTDTISFATIKPAEGDNWWEMKRVMTISAQTAGPLPPEPGGVSGCPASEVEGLLGASIVYGTVQSPLGPGVQITSMGGGGLAAHLGLHSGDVVIACDDMATGCPRELIAILMAAQSHDTCKLTIARGSKRMDFSFKPVSAG